VTNGGVAVSYLFDTTDQLVSITAGGTTTPADYDPTICWGKIPLGATRVRP
jgi:hypothetical protein